MRRLGGIAAVVALLAVPGALALDGAQRQALVRVAVKLSGLSAREPVRLVVERPAAFQARRAALLDRTHPRGAQGYDETIYRALGLARGPGGVLRSMLLALQDQRGLYDPAVRTAYVQAGTGEEAAALHAVVYALEDQHVHLARIGRVTGGDDARIAARAAVEGYARLVTHVQARPASRTPREQRLRRFLELRRGFVESAGRRFVADVRYVGGSKAAIDALRRFPATSEQVFHLDKYLQREPTARVALPARVSGLTLARKGTFGEVDVRALLTTFGVPRAERAGTGWGGGSTARYIGAGGAVAVALEWDTVLDALQWAAAVPRYVAVAFAPAGRPVPCAATTCWRAGPGAVAFDRSGARTALVIGGDPARVEALAEAITGRR